MLNIDANNQEFNVPEDYKVRPGTIDHGKEYEFKVAALLCVRCLGTDTQQMWLAMNPEGCGAFDDVILCRKSDDGVAITYFIQLKHKENEAELKPNALRATKGDFSLNKYIADIQILIPSKSKQAREKILNYLQNPNQIFVLFTNKDTEDESYLQSVDDPVLDFINIGGKCYKIIYSKIGRVLSKSEEELTKHLFLFTKQMNVISINEAIEDGLLAGFPNVNLPRKVLTEKFIFYVTEWSKGHLGGHYPLDKTRILKKILELIFEEYLFKVNYSEIVDSAQQTRIWHDIAKKTPVMVIEDDAFVKQFIEIYIGGIVLRRNEEIKKLCNNDLNVAKKNLMRDVGSMSYGDVYEYLWKNEGVPLVLQINNLEALQNILNILELVPDIFRVIILIGSDVKLPVLVKKYLSTTLADISKKQQVSILLRPIRLQGRVLKLQEAISDQYLHLVTVRDIIHILLGKFNIGGQVNSLPEFFVARSIQKIYLKCEVLEKVTKDKFVIQCKSIADFQKFLEARKLSIDQSDVCTYEGIETSDYRIIITEKEENFEIPNTAVHYLILHHTNELEYIKSVGGIDKIQEFRVKSKVTNSTKDVSSIKHAFPKLISSGPGMGKTVLLDYIAHSASVSLWVLLVNLPKHCEYYKREDFDELEPFQHIQYLFETFPDNCSNLTKTVFNKHLEHKSIYLLLDAYDEVPVSYQKNVLKLIKSLYESNYMICVTTRPGVKADLEKLFKNFAADLSPFTKAEQIKFLLDFYDANFSQNKITIESFVLKLLRAAELNFSAIDNEFIGVPLQTKLIADVFNSDCKTYLATNEFICERFDLLSLYRRFIKEKIEIVCKKYDSSNQDIYTDYMNYRSLLALQVLFDKNELKELEVEAQLRFTLKTIPNALQKVQKDGIVVAETPSNVTFVHRSFAEFLAAEWFAENIFSEDKQIVQGLIHKLFGPNYTVVRNMFDRILADGFDLHSAIINGNASGARNYIKLNWERLNEVDKGGRTFLHLMAAWGTRHPPQSTGPNPKEFVKTFGYLLNQDKNSMNDVLRTQVPSKQLNEEKDIILGYTALDYAIAQSSLDIIDSICLKLTKINGRIDTIHMDKELLQCYIKEFHYYSLDCSMIQQSLTKDLQEMINKYLDLPRVKNNLHHAVRDGKIEDVQTLLSNEPDVNSMDAMGYTALHIAALFGHNAIMNLLLSSKNIDVNKTDCASKTGLHYATARGYIDVVSLLLDNGASTLVTDNMGMCPLHYAVVISSNSQHDIIKLFLSHGANPNTQDAKGRTALHYAVHYNQKDVVNLLLTKIDVDIQDNTGQTALQWAMEKPNTDIVELLYTRLPIGRTSNTIRNWVKGFALESLPPDVLKWTKLDLKNRKGLIALDQQSESSSDSDTSLDLSDLDSKAIGKLTELHLEAQRGRLEVLLELLSKEIDLEAKDEDGRTALHFAVIAGHFSVVSELLSRGANVEAQDRRNYTVLHYAAMAGNLEIMTVILANNAKLEVTCDGNRTALHLAAVNGHVAVVRELSTRGANLDAADDEKHTALHLAIQKGHGDVVQELLSHCLNLEATDAEDNTALHLAIKNGHLEIVSELLTKGANIEARNDESRTALHLVARAGFLAVVTEVISKGADLDAKDMDECTPLELAAEEGHTQVVSELLSKGADIEATNEQCQTALHVAAEAGHLNVVSLLLERGANLEARDDSDSTAVELAADEGRLDVVAALLSKGAHLDE